MLEPNQLPTEITELSQVCPFESHPDFWWSRQFFRAMDVIQAIQERMLHARKEADTFRQAFQLAERDLTDAKQRAEKAIAAHLAAVQTSEYWRQGCIQATVERDALAGALRNLVVVIVRDTP